MTILLGGCKILATEGKQGHRAPIHPGEVPRGGKPAARLKPAIVQSHHIQFAVAGEQQGN